jgi:hypothetical protein
MLWKGGWGRQIMFVRDDLCGLVSWGRRGPRIRAHVISTHTSKSIALPVYRLARPDLGLELYLRDNFYNWKLSVVSTQPIVADFSGLFHTTPPIDPKYTGDPLHSVYFEGFPKELVFGYYEPSDKRRWSAEIHGDQALWATLFLLMRSVGAVQPSRWNTPETHKAEMEADRKAWAEAEARGET